jgi:hypothetical protein
MTGEPLKGISSYFILENFNKLYIPILVKI